GLIKRAHEIAFRAAANCFYASGVWIVTTNSAIGSEPDYLFAILKDVVNMIRAQPTAGPIEGESLRLLLVGKKKHAVAVGCYPNIAVQIAYGGDGSGRCLIADEVGRAASRQQARLVFAHAFAHPKLAIRIHLERAYKKCCGTVLTFAAHPIDNRQQSATK